MENQSLKFNFIFLGQSVLRYEVPLDVYDILNHIYETRYPELKPGRPIGGHLGSLKRPVVSVHKDWAFVATNELPYPDTKWRKKWIGTQHVPQGSRLGQAITSRGTPEVAKMVRKAKPVLKAVGKVGTGLSGVGTAWAAYDAIKWAQQWHEENPGAVLKLKEEAKFQPGSAGKYGVDY